MDGGSSFIRATRVCSASASLSETYTLPSRCSTRQHDTGSSAVGRSGAPLRRLKQAWCQGQRTVSAPSSSSASGRRSAIGADREQVVAAACQQDRFAACVAEHDRAVGDLRSVDALGEVGATELGFGFVHLKSFAFAHSGAANGGPKLRQQLRPRHNTSSTSGLVPACDCAGRSRSGADGNQVVLLVHRRCQSAFDLDAEQAMPQTCAKVSALDVR